MLQSFHTLSLSVWERMPVAWNIHIIWLAKLLAVSERPNAVPYQVRIRNVNKETMLRAEHRIIMWPFRYWVLAARVISIDRLCKSERAGGLALGGTLGSLNIAPFGLH